MPLRSARCYRKVKRPYTRKEYIKSIPDVKIRKFMFGNKKGTFDVEFKIIAKAPFQVRSNALEALRIGMLSQLRQVPQDNYFVLIHPHPHHILRKHGMAGGHKAERLQKGMRLAFGKPDGRAAQLEPNQVIVTAKVKNEYVEEMRQALKVAMRKLPPFVALVKS